jgi:apolipoprotein N-acyltransferase
MPNKLRYFLILILSILAAWMGYEMWNLPLWAYRPLFFFLSFTLALLLLIKPWFEKYPKGEKLLALSGLAALLLYLGFPTMPFTPVLFVAFVPLLIIEDELYHWRKGTSKWQLFKYTFAAFVLWNILSTFWVANTSFIPSIAAFTLNSVFMSVPLLLYHHVRKKLGDRYRWPALLCFWISFEYGHMAWEISWPWLTIGNAFSQYPSWIQWYEFTGHLGGTFWMLAGNIFAYEVYCRWKRKESLIHSSLWKGLALIIVPIVISLAMYYNYEEQGEAVEVAVLQGNYEPHYQKFNNTEYPPSAQLENFINLSKQVVTESTEYLVLPETSFWVFDIDNLNIYPRIQTLQDYISGFENLKLVTGLVSRKELDPNGELPSWTRSFTRDSKTIYWELQNSAVQLKGNADDYQVHIKSKLVPGPEIFPYNNILFFLKPIVEGAGGTLSGHARRDERTVFKDGDKGVAPVICYESVYGEYVGEYIRKGAQAIFIITNDGWWDDTPGYIQHLKFAQLRAIEHRRPIARSANTGISCFINQRGDISQATTYETPAAIKEEIMFNKKVTFYSKWGDLIARLAMLGSIIFFFALIVKKYRK